MMLRWRTNYAHEADYSTASRYATLSAEDGEEFQLASWVRQRPVLHLSQGVLMTHGGLSELVSQALKEDEAGNLKAKCETSAAACGLAMVDFVNRGAYEYYASLHKCIMESGGANEAKQCDSSVE